MFWFVLVSMFWEYVVTYDDGNSTSISAAFYVGKSDLRFAVQDAFR